MTIELTDFPPSDDEAGLLTRLRRRKALVATVFLLIAAATAFIYYITPPTYLATGQVMITPPASQAISADLTPAAEQKLGDPADIDSQTLVLKSPRLLADALRKPGVANYLLADCTAHQGASFTAKIRAAIGKAKSCDMMLAGNASVAWFSNHLIIGAAGRSRVVQISYQSASPQAAAGLVNALIDSYLAQGAASKQASRARAESWIRSQLADIGGALRQSELQLEAFRREHGLVRGQTASIASERLSQVSQQLAVAEAAATDAGAKLGQVRGGAGNSAEALESRPVADLKQRLSEVSGDLASLTSTHGPQYPGLVALQQQRSELQRRIGDETGRVQSSLQGTYAGAAAQAASLRKQMDQLKGDVAVGDLAEAQIASMVRDNDIKREVYVDLFKKANDLEAERQLLTGDAQLINYADVPDTITSPKLLLFIVAGTIMATIVAAGAAVFRDRSDTTVRTSGRLESQAGVGVLGIIPKVRLGVSNGKQGALQQQPPELQEAVRALYTRCIFLAGAARPRTVLLTSSNIGEGKSFLTLAMAQFGASTGQRILAVEGDLRRPTFRATLGLVESPGLVGILRSKTDYREAVQTCKLGFDVVIAGAATSASTELLSNGSIGSFLGWAKENYDLVLLDSPPVQMLMDAEVMASQVDGVLHCSHWGRSSVESVAHSIRSLRRAGGKVLGVVLDMVALGDYELYDTVSAPRTGYLMAPA